MKQGGRRNQRGRGARSARGRSGDRAAPPGRGGWTSLPATLRREVSGVVLLAVAALGLVALMVHPAGRVLTVVATLLHAGVGVLAPVGPAVLAGAGAWLIFGHGRPAGGRGAGLALLLLAACGFAGVGIARRTAFLTAWHGDGGGLVGASIDWLLVLAFGPAGRDVVLVGAALAGALLIGQFSLRVALTWPFRRGAGAAGGLGRALYDFVTEDIAEDAPCRVAETGSPALVAGGADVPLLAAGAEPDGPATGPKRRKRTGTVAPNLSLAVTPDWAMAAEAVRDDLTLEAAVPTDGDQGQAVQLAPSADTAPFPAGVGHDGLEAHDQSEPEDTVEVDGASMREALPPQPVPVAMDSGLVYQFPPLDLMRKLRKGRTTRSHSDAAQRATAVEDALKSFGVAAQVVDVVQGPSVTRYEVHPGIGVKVARISNLADDLALALAATDVRIVAPIPGKAAVGIEVPNTDVTPVYLRDVIETPEFQSSTSPLTVCLGQDIAGRPVVASLPRLFHLLVAGATGSGKSITLNAMLISILYKARPDEVKLVLIDPKMVEMAVYNGIPHLLAPVVTDARKAAATLRTVVKEMEKRYALFSEAGARDLPRYNVLAGEKGIPPLPYVVVVIDELADLMLVARGEVEDAIQRLTQMARAAGIHLIVATQRPSVDVITGVIKANIPSRIALTVSSQVDSRTILDVAGAERLVGRGDMLFRPVGAQKVVRAQGAFIADTEVEAVLDFLRHAGQPEYDTAIMAAEADGEGESDAGQDDALFMDALQIVVESRQASVSNLQRRLRVGFTRAGRLVDMMEQRGFVGAHQGSKSREVLLSAEQFARLFGERRSG